MHGFQPAGEAWHALGLMSVVGSRGQIARNATFNVWTFHRAPKTNFLTNHFYISLVFEPIPYFGFTMSEFTAQKNINKSTHFLESLKKIFGKKNR